MKIILAIATIVILFFLSASVYLKNSELITLEYYFGIEWSVNVATLLLCSFLVGLFVGAMLVSFSLMGQKLKTGRAHRQLKRVEKEVEGLRAAPVDV